MSLLYSPQFIYQPHQVHTSDYIATTKQFCKGETFLLPSRILEIISKNVYSYLGIVYFLSHFNMIKQVPIILTNKNFLQNIMKKCRRENRIKCLIVLVEILTAYTGINYANVRSTYIRILDAKVRKFNLTFKSTSIPSLYDFFS